MPLPVTLPHTIPAQGSRGYRVHTLLCRGSGLPVHFLVAPANRHDALFARPLLELAVRLYRLRPRIIRLDAAHWGEAPHPLDSRDPGSYCRGSLESQATQESLVFATDVDQRGIGQTQFH